MVWCPWAAGAVRLYLTWRDPREPCGPGNSYLGHAAKVLVEHDGDDYS